MRVFVAIDIDRSIRKALGDLQRQLQGKLDIKKGDVKWVSPEAMHLTLKFLGEIKDEKVVEVCNIIKDVADRRESFELDVESVGCFGGKSARVVWVGCGRNCDLLHRLQEDIEHHLADAGWPEEKRRFTGHLTLCRVRNPRAGFRLAQLTEAYRDFRLGTMSAEAVVVYQSQLRPSGPVYTALGNYKLQSETGEE
ncbi:MAG: RNA 2',3'-cyclic phosphodiesterase [Planctomycetota bacterium]|jgi:2'-5' RNA ligase